jgi:hypothetical protein
MYTVRRNIFCKIHNTSTPIDISYLVAAQSKPIEPVNQGSPTGETLGRQIKLYTHSSAACSLFPKAIFTREDGSKPITLWKTNIAVENHHF